LAPPHYSFTPLLMRASCHRIFNQDWVLRPLRLFSRAASARTHSGVFPSDGRRRRFSRESAVQVQNVPEK